MFETIATQMYANYIVERNKTGYENVKIEPVIDPICKQLKISRREFGTVFLEPILGLCLNRSLPFQMMLEVDATWRDQAAWFRRKRENQVVIDGYRPVRIIAMKVRPTKE